MARHQRGIDTSNVRQQQAAGQAVQVDWPRFIRRGGGHIVIQWEVEIVFLKRPEVQTCDHSYSLD